MSRPLFLPLAGFKVTFNGRFWVTAEGNTCLNFLLLATLVGFAPNAMADTPKAQLQETMERVMAITQTFRSEKDFTDNKARLKQTILPRFDFDEMARRSLGDEIGRAHV